METNISNNLHITTKSYLTKRDLNIIFDKDLSQDDIDKLMFNEGLLIRHHSYYKITEKFLRENKLVPDTITLSTENFNNLAKKSSYTLNDIATFFSLSMPEDRDIVEIIVNRYFFKKYNLWYKNDIINELLSEGILEYEI